MKNLNKKCVLDDNKYCNDCHNCMYCDLDPERLCNNCAACINNDADFQAIIIEDIITLDEELEAKENKKYNKEEIKNYHQGIEQ